MHETHSNALPLKLTPLFHVFYAVTPLQNFGDTPFGRRLHATTTGGTFTGPRLKGEILPGGTDWITIGADASMRLDVNVVMKTDDGALIHAHWAGKVVAPPRVQMLLADPVKRAEIDPASYYYRLAAEFATGAEAHRWLNGIVAIGSARFTTQGLHYSFASLD